MYRIRQFVLKVASRCNLNCSYCYVYNKGDASWRDRPAVMSNAVFSAAIGRIAEYCVSSGSKTITIGFHGGEPCLIGPGKIDQWCKAIRRELPGVDVLLTLQTNATLLNREWIDVIAANRLNVGVSLDGLAEHHDQNRLDRKGRPTHHQTMRGIGLLREARIKFGLICVIPMGADPVAVHSYLLATGASEVRYLFPDFTHDTFPRFAEGETPCADFMVGVFGEWVKTERAGTSVTDLRNMCRVILGSESRDEAIGNSPPGYLFVDTDGSIGGLDVLSICEPGLPSLGSSVFDSCFEAIDVGQFRGT